MKVKIVNVNMQVPLEMEDSELQKIVYDLLMATSLFRVSDKVEVKDWSPDEH